MQFTEASYVLFTLIWIKQALLQQLPSPPVNYQLITSPWRTCWPHLVPQRGRRSLLQQEGLAQGWAPAQAGRGTHLMNLGELGLSGQGFLLRGIYAPWLWGPKYPAEAKKCSAGTCPTLYNQQALTSPQSTEAVLEKLPAPDKPDLSSNIAK